MTILLDSLFVKLRIISQIPEDARLSTTYPDNITVEYDGMLQCIKRRLFRESRKDTIKVLREIVDSIVDISNYLMNSMYLNIYTIKENPSEQELEQYDTELKDLTNIKEEINNSIKGFKNLKTTYKHDPIVLSELDIMMRNLEMQFNNIETKIEQIKKF